MWICKTRWYLTLLTEPRTCKKCVEARGGHSREEKLESAMKEAGGANGDREQEIAGEGRPIVGGGNPGPEQSGEAHGANADEIEPGRARQ